MDLISRLGPLSAGELRNELFDAGRITRCSPARARPLDPREHDTVDRRRVMVAVARRSTRNGRSLPGCAARRARPRRYSEEQLDLIADFLRRTTAIAQQRSAPRS